ncbi:MAG: hypothetical protein JSS82_16060 [Bacteroidetes bacterium]|nr:hypothetical protein [Bacteroidota bacterium]
MSNTFDNFQPNNRVFAYLLFSILSVIGLLQYVLMREVARVHIDPFGRVIPWGLAGVAGYFIYKLVRHGDRLRR